MHPRTGLILWRNYSGREIIQSPRGTGLRWLRRAAVEHRLASLRTDRRGRKTRGSAFTFGPRRRRGADNRAKNKGAPRRGKIDLVAVVFFASWLTRRRATNYLRDMVVHGFLTARLLLFYSFIIFVSSVNTAPGRQVMTYALLHAKFWSSRGTVAQSKREFQTRGDSSEIFQIYISQREGWLF